MGSGEIGNHAVSLWLVRVDLEEAVQEGRNPGPRCDDRIYSEEAFMSVLRIELHLQYDIDFC